jgi:8-oxo-dGTP pyrophosphatase MutT (NUDIX family)
VFARLQVLLLRAYGRLPRNIRKMIVRTVAPSYHVGAMCVIERADGQLLLVRQAYRGGWTVPGGLLRRNEEPAVGARREAQEEVGLIVDLQGEPTVIIDATARRIDVVYRCSVGPPEPEIVTPNSVEIVEARWFALEQLPALQKEVYEAFRRIGVLQRR